MKRIHALLALPAFTLALAAPVYAATDSGPGAGGTDTSRQAERSSHGYKYDRSLNAGGRAGGSTVPRGAEQPYEPPAKTSRGYEYDRSMNAGGAGGGSTVPRAGS